MWAFWWNWPLGSQCRQGAALGRVRIASRDAACGVDSGIPATIFTTTDGVIEWVDAAAGKLLHCSPAACRGRNLIVFFGKNRLAAMEALSIARAGEVVHGSGVIRPRERKPRSVMFTVTPDSEHTHSLKWVFEADAVS